MKVPLLAHFDARLVDIADLSYVQLSGGLLTFMFLKVSITCCMGLLRDYRTRLKYSDASCPFY